jgi:phytoene synthase
MAEPLREIHNADGVEGPAELVRTRDKARWIACLNAPEPIREDLLTLHAFDLELARARDVTSQPLLAEIRLTWWQKTIDQVYAGLAPRAHEVAKPLADVIQRHDLSKDLFDRLIAARIEDAEEAAPESLAVLVDRAGDLGAPFIAICAELMSDDDVTDAAIQAGTAVGLVSMVRAIPLDLARGRLRLPTDLLAQSGISPAQALSGADLSGLQAAAAGLLAIAAEAIADMRLADIPAIARPAFYPAVLAEGEAHWLMRYPGEAYPEYRMIARLWRLRLLRRL